MSDSFPLGNLRLQSTLFILVLTVPGMVKDGPLTFGGYLKRLTRAFNRGRQTRELLSVPYERFWSEPVTELVEQLGIAPA